MSSMKRLIYEKSISMKMTAMEDMIEHFSGEDIIISFFGAFLVAIAFIFRGNFIQISLQLSKINLVMIFIATIAALSAEIYLLGYSRVRHKEKRPFCPFWFKRILTVYITSILACFLIVVLYNIPNTVPGVNISNMMNIIISASFPSSIGAALTDLFKRF